MTVKFIKLSLTILCLVALAAAALYGFSSLDNDKISIVSASPSASVETSFIDQASVKLPTQEDLPKEVFEYRRLFGTPKVDPNLNPDLISLGDQLFHDPRLSSNNTLSCSSCHILEQGGDDNVAFSTGISGNQTSVNSPTVFNLVGHVAYFWDGRAENLADQIDGPVNHPDEMGSNWKEIISKLVSDENYTTRFKALPGYTLDERGIKAAIIEFEKSLITSDSPFDQYMNGNIDALTTEAQNGAKFFTELGCVSCHQGPLMGSNMFQQLGIFKPYEYEKSSQEVLKVPSLRNVQLTAPYLHDGSLKTLNDVVRVMSEYQLGHQLSEDEENSIVAFLHSLTSENLKASMPKREQ